MRKGKQNLLEKQIYLHISEWHEMFEQLSPAICKKMLLQHTSMTRIDILSGMNI